MESRQPSAEGNSVPPFADLVLRTGPNWTAVAFLGMLGGLHLTIAVPSMFAGRWAAYLSLAFGSVFVIVSAVIYFFRCEVALLSSQRRVRIRTGVGRLAFERFIPFASVRAVRLMVEPGLRSHPSQSMIELLCRGEDVLCPPTTIPRQQALFMAMAINVPLIKVCEAEAAVPPAAAADDEASLRRP